jgi:hypothetical protein
MAAQTLWRQYPGEIASDLSQYHRRRIADWHDGTMSSYELLELCEHLPERGALKTAARGGEWSQEEQAIYQIANELAVLRAAQVPQVDSGEYGSRLFLSPAKLSELAQEAAEVAEAREAVYAMADRSSR